MYEPAGLVQVDGSFAGPRVQLFPVDALVSCEIEPRIASRCFPFVGNQADVRTTHGTLPDEVKTVF